MTVYPRCKCAEERDLAIARAEKAEAALAKATGPEAVERVLLALGRFEVWNFANEAVSQWLAKHDSGYPELATEVRARVAAAILPPTEPTPEIAPCEVDISDAYQLVKYRENVEETLWELVPDGPVLFFKRLSDQAVTAIFKRNNRLCLFDCKRDAANFSTTMSAEYSVTTKAELISYLDSLALGKDKLK